MQRFRDGFAAIAPMRTLGELWDRDIAAAARDLVQKRDAWLNPPGAAPEELTKRTLTHLYNERPTWLQLTDNAVAFGHKDELTFGGDA